jgi:hypothetical protein
MQIMDNIFVLVLVYIFYRRDNGQWTQVTTMYNRKLYILPRSLLDLVHRISYTTTFTIETYFYISYSRQL